MHNAAAYLTAQDREEAIWRTLITDREVSGIQFVRASGSGLRPYRFLHSSRDRHFHDPHLLNLPANADLDSQGVPDTNLLLGEDLSLRSVTSQFLATVQLHNSNKRLFVTSNGYIGLGPKHIQEGDEVVVLAGAMVPYIFREDQSGTYRLVGDSYVHGIMDGEALTKTREFKNLKTFAVR